MNQVLETNAISVEGILYWSYGVSNRSGVRSPQISDERPGRVSIRMQDLRAEAAFVQSEVNRELKWPHLRAIIEAKYGERSEAVRECATILKKTARTQSIEQLVRVVESYCEWRPFSVREMSREAHITRQQATLSKTRYEGILEGWHSLAIGVVGMVFQERGWVE